MGGNTKEWLTTGQAAKLCSVTSDTVLKWIRRGRLSGVRTAGGHYRVARRDVKDLMTPHVAVESSPHHRHSDAPLRCWEYLAGRGKPREECESCTVYQVRAGRCYAMRGLGEGVEHHHQLCSTTCGDCIYYRRVMNLATQVLLITRDPELTTDLEAGTHEEVAVHIVRSGYEASAVIQEFHPAFTIVDEARDVPDSPELVNNLAADARIPGMKVILAVAPGHAERRRKDLLPDSVVSIIEKPFELQHVAEIIAQFPVEALHRSGEAGN